MDPSQGIRQGLGQHDRAGQPRAVEVTGLVPTEELVTVGLPVEAAPLPFKEPGENHARFGWVTGCEPPERLRRGVGIAQVAGEGMAILMAGDQRWVAKHFLDQVVVGGRASALPRL
jgi:hypothetical protein